jgi:4-diphosphocytidyl-2-C-methyl-D-erythritol kinase
MSISVRSYSKINLGLAVGPARKDGFHGLATVYQTLALHDVVSVTARAAAATQIRLTSNHPGVPTTKSGTAERNTAWKMVAGVLKRLGMTAEVDVHIEKRLPVQGGMGAGSANAVAALVGLERELRVALPEPERMKLAASVGSDVPLFLVGGTVLGLGRGEEVSPLEEAGPNGGVLQCVVAVPGAGVSTALAFRDLDLKMRQAEERSLTSGASVDKLEKLSYAVAAVWPERDRVGVEAGPSGITRPEQSKGIQGDLAENPLLALVRTGIENDFEEVVFSQHPSLRSTKRDLLGSSGDGAVYAALSGSGSALFALYESKVAAIQAQRRVQNHGTRAILTETLPRQRYWHEMFAE